MVSIFEGKNPGENVSKLLPTTVADYMSGFFGILPTTATVQVKKYWLKSGKEIPQSPTDVIKTTQIKTSGDFTATSSGAPLSADAPLLGHSFHYDATEDDICVFLAWIEVSGAIIHPISIEALTNKSPIPIPWQGLIIPAKSVFVKGMFRSSTSMGTDYEKDPTYTKHTVSTTLLYKYKVVVVDENDWSADNIPDYATLKGKLDSYYNKTYMTLCGLLKYRL
jgi:hypothetical protein